MPITLKIDDPGLRKTVALTDRKVNQFMDEVAQVLVEEWRHMMEETPRRWEPKGPSYVGNPPAIQTELLITSLEQPRRVGKDREFYGPDYALELNDSAQKNRPYIEPGLATVMTEDVPGLAKDILNV